MRIDPTSVDRLVTRRAEFKAFPAAIFGGRTARSEVIALIDATSEVIANAGSGRTAVVEDVSATRQNASMTDFSIAQTA